MLVLSLIILFLLGLNVFKWYRVAFSHYDKETLQPGDTYHVGDRTYTLPNLPLEGSAYKLNEEFLLSQRALIQKVHGLFESLKIQYWIAGGTLLGFHRDKAQIVWDDDQDIHTYWKNREFLFSSEFKNAASTHQLEVIFLKGMSLNWATKEGACVRLRHAHSTFPVCDIFFVKTMEREQSKKRVQKFNEKQLKLIAKHLKQGQPDATSQLPSLDENIEYVAKVDSWSGSSVRYSRREFFTQAEVFPLETKEVDGLTLSFPHQPDNILKRQYGNDALTHMKARSPWVSHAYPFRTLHWIWRK